MFTLDHWYEIFQSLQRHKLRTALTAFGVFWGIFMFVLLLAAGTGLERGIIEIFKDDAINSVWIEGGKTSLPHQGFTPGRQIKLTIDDVTTLEQVLQGAENVSPRKALPGQFPVTYGEKASSFQILGVYPGYNTVERTLLLLGRMLNPLDASRRRKVALIGERVVELLFDDTSDPVGRRIIIKGVSFQVIGTFTDAGGEGELRRIYIPFTTLQECFDQKREVDLITFTIPSGQSGQAMKTSVLTYLSKQHHFAPHDRSAVYYWEAEEDYRKFTALLLGIKVFVALVGLGTLFAGVVGVSNIMLISVRERTREIGIRKAIGATPLSILSMVLQEALVITTLAGYAGLVAGVAVIEGIRAAGFESDYFRDPQVDLSVALVAVGVLIVAGLAAGFLPARQAVKIKPIEALRYE